MNYELPGDYRGGHFAPYPVLSPETSPEDFESSLFETRDDNVIKFQALHMPPYIITKTSGNESFYAFGPLYSITHEVGKRINFSMKGDNIDMASGGVSWERAIAFAPDIVLTPMMPNIDTMLSALDFGFAEFSRTFDSVEIDHILARREYRNTSFFAIFKAFDFEIWIGILVTLIASFAASFISKFLTNRININTFPKSEIWRFFLITCLFGSPDFGSIQGHVWRSLSLFYTLYAFLLKTLISGDLLTVLTLGAQPNSIDTFEKLATRETYIPIKAFGALNEDPEEARLMYFKEGFPFKDSLTERLELIAIETQLDNQVASEMLYEVSQGLRIQLGLDVAMRYCINHWFDGNYSEVINFSDDYGYTMPGFMLQLMSSNPKFKTSLEFVLLQLLESGIFNKWLEYHIGDSKFIDNQFHHDDTVTTLGSLILPSMIIGFGLVISGLTTAVEFILGKFSERKFRKPVVSIEDSISITNTSNKSINKILKVKKQTNAEMKESPKHLFLPSPATPNKITKSVIAEIHCVF